MKESYSKELTNHTGPESCEVFSNELLEALTGVRAGWILSREIPIRDANDVGGAEGNAGQTDLVKFGRILPCFITSYRSSYMN